MCLNIKKCILNSIINTQRFFVSLVQTPLRTHILHIFEEAGINLGSDSEKPWNLILKDERDNKLFIEFGISPYLGLGSTFVEGRWKCEDLLEFLCKLFQCEIGLMCGHWYHKRHNQFIKDLIYANAQPSHKSIGYFFDNNYELLSQMTNGNLDLSSGDWNLDSNEPKINSLNQAMEFKYLQIMNKIKLKPGMRLLLIGSISPKLSQHLARQNPLLHFTCVLFGVKMLEIFNQTNDLKNISIKNIQHTDLNSVLKDELYDCVVAIEPFQYLYSNTDEFFNLIFGILESNGKLYLETRGNFNPKYPLDDLFSQKFISTSGFIPTSSSILESIQSKWNLLSWKSVDENYIKTIKIWKNNLKNNSNGISLSKLKIWEFNLSLYEAAFKTKKLNTWNILLVKNL